MPSNVYDQKKTGDNEIKYNQVHAKKKWTDKGKINFSLLMS